LRWLKVNLWWTKTPSQSPSFYHTPCPSALRQPPYR